MPVISFIHPDGRKERVEAAEGESAMQAATRHGIDGIVAECGGNAMCATCHVYVDESWTGRLPAIGDDEDALLDGAAAAASREQPPVLSDQHGRRTRRPRAAAAGPANLGEES